MKFKVFSVFVAAMTIHSVRAINYPEPIELGFQKILLDPVLNQGDELRGTFPPGDHDQLQFRTRAPQSSGPAIVKYTFVPEIFNDVSGENSIDIVVGIHENSRAKLDIGLSLISKQVSEDYNILSSFYHFGSSSNERLRWNFDLYSMGSDPRLTVEYGFGYRAEIVNPTNLTDITASGATAEFQHFYGEAHVYSFRLNQSRQLTIDLTGTSPDIYPVFSLYQSDGKSLERANYSFDEEGNPTLPVLTRNLSAGQYYLVLGDYNVGFDRDDNNELKGWDRRGFESTPQQQWEASPYFFNIQVGATQPIAVKARKILKTNALAELRKKYRRLRSERPRI